MNIKVLEHDGVYTAYQSVLKRNDAGILREAVKRIDIPFPPPDESAWEAWVVGLSEPHLDVALQVFFDKWNFGRGAPEEHRIYSLLHTEREARRNDGINPTADILSIGTVTIKGGTGGTVKVSKSR